MEKKALFFLIQIMLSILSFISLQILYLVRIISLFSLLKVKNEAHLIKYQCK